MEIVLCLSLLKIIPLPNGGSAKCSPETETVKQTEKTELQKEREADYKLLGIEPDSTSVMDISNRPPLMASRKSGNDSLSPGAGEATTSVASAENLGTAEVSTTNSISEKSVTKKSEKLEAQSNEDGPPRNEADSHQDGKYFRHYPKQV